MSDQMNNEVIPPQKHRTILQLPILSDLDDDNWLLVTAKNKTYRIAAGVFARLLSTISIDKVELGLDKVDNTSDLDKPLSTAVTVALEDKASKLHLHEVDDIQGLKAFVEDILDNVLEIRSYVRSDVLELMLETKADKADILERLESKLDKDLLETLVNKDELSEALLLKANASDVELLASKAEVEEALELKADKAEVQALAEGKADKTAIANLATKDELTDSLVGKLDVSAAEDLVSKVELDEKLSNKVDSEELDNYPTKTDVEQDLSSKADKTALNDLATKQELEEGLDNKIDKITAGTYATKQELLLYHTKDEVNAALGLKLNISDFEDAVADIQAQKGDPGEQGMPGQDGKDGVDGAPGEDGKSAYEIAVENGFTGNIEDWLTSLKGEKGEKGDPGEQGAPGQDGIDGAPGEDGQDGADGSDGAPGEDGKSAFELAVSEGFEGTLQEWLLSLKGEKGEKGDPGEGGSGGNIAASSGFFDYKNLLLDSNFEETLSKSPFQWNVSSVTSENITSAFSFMLNENGSYKSLLGTTNNILAPTVAFNETPVGVVEAIEVGTLTPTFLNAPDGFYKLGKTDSSFAISLKYNLPINISFKIKVSYFDEDKQELNSVISDSSEIIEVPEGINENPSLIYEHLGIKVFNFNTTVPEDAVYAKFEYIFYVEPDWLDRYAVCTIYVYELQIEVGTEASTYETNNLIKDIRKLASEGTSTVVELLYSMGEVEWPYIDRRPWGSDVVEDYIMSEIAHGKVVLYDGASDISLRIPNDLPLGFRCDIVIGNKYPQNTVKIDIEGEQLVWAEGSKNSVTRSSPISLAKISSTVVMVYGGE